MQVAVDHRRIEVLGQLDALVHALGHDHAAAGDDDRKLGLGQQRRCIVQTALAAGAALDELGPGDLDVDLAVEVVARDVELRRAALGERPVKAAPGEFGDAAGTADVSLVLGDLGEDRQLLGLLEPAEAHGRRAGLRRNGHDRRMGPVGRRDRGHEIRNARSVLADAHALSAAHPRVAVGHVRRALLVHRGDEADAGGRKDVERVHVGRADDAEDVRDPVARQGLDKGFARCHAGHVRGPPELIV